MGSRNIYDQRFVGSHPGGWLPLLMAIAAIVKKITRGTQLPRASVNGRAADVTLKHDNAISGIAFHIPPRNF